VNNSASSLRIHLNLRHTLLRPCTPKYLLLLSLRHPFLRALHHRSVNFLQNLPLLLRMPKLSPSRWRRKVVHLIRPCNILRLIPLTLTFPANTQLCTMRHHTQALHIFQFLRQHHLCHLLSHQSSSTMYLEAMRVAKVLGPTRNRNGSSNWRSRARMLGIPAILSGIGLYINGDPAGPGMSLLFPKSQTRAHVVDRHQILIKATALGLKASSSRGQKRRRDTTNGPEEDGTPAPATSASAPPSAITQAEASTSPPMSQSVSANASPAIQNSHPPPQTSALAWPAPVIAANTASPLSSGQPESTQSYYRPRQTDKPDSLSSHHYVYHPNGKGAGGSKFSKQNGQ
jgi:hypothetical protein